MSADNTLESDVADLVLRGIDPAWRAAATGYVALFTSDPGETGSLAAECSDAAYARVAVTKSSGWSTSGSTRTNAGQVAWPTLSGAGSDLTHWAWVSSASGATAYMLSGALSTPVPWAPGVKPVAEAGTLSTVIARR